MHLKIFVEDSSGELLLDILLEKIIGKNGDLCTWETHPYKGLGNRIPKGLKPGSDPSKRILLDQIPKIVNGVARSMERMGRDQYATIIITDLDRRDCREFKKELLSTLDGIYPIPRIFFRIAIEEMEAWLLGDTEAVLTAYPGATKQKLDSYIPDSICGTWEFLAEAISEIQLSDIKKRPYTEIGKMKAEWALEIGVHIDIERNRSPSFHMFRSLLNDIISGNR